MKTNKQSGFESLLQQSLTNIAAHDRYDASKKDAETMHVPSVANIVLQAYEQLRNASENIEDHLLLQRAILRFYRRSLPLTARDLKTAGLAQELVIELTQAGYLKNNTLPLTRINEIDTMITQYISLYWKSTDARDVSNVQVEKWILELLSVRTEQTINNPIRIISFARFAHAYISQVIDYKKVLPRGSTVAPHDYPTLLYIGIHKALLKSDDANTRSDLMDLAGISATKSKHFIEFNQQYDALSSSKEATWMMRFVSKNGASLRIIRSTFFEHTDNTSIDVTKKDRTMNIVDTQIDHVYKDVRKSVSRAVIKSVIFLLITKSLIGLLVEIPYDIIVHSSIVWLPLIINLLFPPVFLAITALTFKLPSESNKQAIVAHIEKMLYGDTSQLPPLKYNEPTSGSSAFNVVYTFVFIAAFYLVIDRLIALDFNIVQGLIFVIFLSTASFLGYRITLQIKELELLTTNQGFIALLRDFLYAPFIFVGRKISYRFGQLNIIAQVLDVAIDLPLKTSVRLIRQWMVFLNNKKDELL